MAFIPTTSLRNKSFRAPLPGNRCPRQPCTAMQVGRDDNDSSEYKSLEPLSSSPSPPSSSSPSKPESVQQRPQPQRRAPAPRRMSAFDATLDNLTMKRMGRGTQYYGERIQADEAPNSDEQFLEGSDQSENLMQLRPGAVVVTGGTGRTGQWVALGLVNNGFNVRVLTRSVPRAEAIFGPSGSNVDIVKGDLTNPQGLPETLASASALVLCSAAPRWLPFTHDAVDARGIENVIRAAVEAKSVRRIILISDTTTSSMHARAKRRAEHVIKECGIPYVIVRASALSDEEGGIRQIDIRPSLSISTSARIKPVTRIDLAQCVCQALVHHRRVEAILEEDPDSGVAFPNCVVTIANSDAPYVPNRRFWPSVFNRVSKTFTLPTDEPVEEDIDNTKDVVM